MSHASSLQRFFEGEGRSSHVERLSCYIQLFLTIFRKPEMVHKIPAYDSSIIAA